MGEKKGRRRGERKEMGEGTGREGRVGAKMEREGRGGGERDNEREGWRREMRRVRGVTQGEEGEKQ